MKWVFLSWSQCQEGGVGVGMRRWWRTRQSYPFRIRWTIHLPFCLDVWSTLLHSRTGVSWKMPSIFQKLPLFTRKTWGTSNSRTGQSSLKKSHWSFCGTWVYCESLNKRRAAVAFLRNRGFFFFPSVQGWKHSRGSLRTSYASKLRSIVVRTRKAGTNVGPLQVPATTQQHQLQQSPRRGASGGGSSWPKTGEHLKKLIKCVTRAMLVVIKGVHF